MKKLFPTASAALLALAFASTGASAVWLKPGVSGAPQPVSPRAKCICARFDCHWNGSEFRYPVKYTKDQVDKVCPARTN